MSSVFDIAIPETRRNKMWSPSIFANINGSGNTSQNGITSTSGRSSASFDGEELVITNDSAVKPTAVIDPVQGTVEVNTIKIGASPTILGTTTEITTDQGSDNVIPTTSAIVKYVKNSSSPSLIVSSDPKTTFGFNRRNELLYGYYDPETDITEYILMSNNKKQGITITNLFLTTLSFPNSTGVTTIERIDTNLLSDLNTHLPTSNLVKTSLATKANSADVYTKTETYTKTEVNALIASSGGANAFNLRQTANDELNINRTTVLFSTPSTSLGVYDFSAGTTITSDIYVQFYVYGSITINATLESTINPIDLVKTFYLQTTYSNRNYYIPLTTSPYDTGTAANGFPNYRFYVQGMALFPDSPDKFTLYVSGSIASTFRSFQTTGTLYMRRDWFSR